MQVFKFGGASVKDSSSVKNVASILKNYAKAQTVVIVSAMGKTTNALEEVVNAYFHNKYEVQNKLNVVKNYHQQLLSELFPDSKHAVYNEIHNLFVTVEWELEEEPSNSYDHHYDQIVSLGELISTKIIHHYLLEEGIINAWLDARDVIKTDDTYREGIVDWQQTEKSISEKLNGFSTNLILTQGFIGCTSENYTTTLGREGSDYTAAIFAYCGNAKNVTIWKDVPGVLNADPKWFDNTVLIDQMSYLDAIELSYYGATVIHPKTIKPLQNKHIPLFVKSFLKPEAPGTVINENNNALKTPCFIFKVNQILLSISPKDFSFIAEKNLSDIFGLFSKHHIKINTMHNSAISFSVCIDTNREKTEAIVKELQKEFRVLYNENVELVTIRYYDQATIDRVTIDKKVLVEVKSRYTAQLVLKNVESGVFDFLNH